MDTFIVGTVTNPLKKHTLTATPVFSEISLKYPSRLNAMALDPSQIGISENGIYTPGEIIFSIDLFKEITVGLRSDNEIVISNTSPRQQLIRHAALLMKHAIGANDGLDIDVITIDLRHCGLGSSSGLIASVASCINELYGNPISKTDLIAYLAQNHGEEIDGDDNHLQHVQCIGGSAASGLVNGGMKILAGESVPIASMNIDDLYTVLIGIPKDYSAPDAKVLMEQEISNMKKFIATGNKYKEQIGFRVTHETIPAMMQDDLRKASRLIFDYRFDYGSIENCSFVYPRMSEIAVNIRYLYENGVADTLALSSVGPAFFAITKFPEQCRDVFENNQLKVFDARIMNDGYEVINKIPL